MKKLIFLPLLLLGLALGNLHAQAFETDYTTAQAKCKESGKTLMMVFSGSDWCKPCILLKKEVLANPEFQAFANEHLIILNLDFPFRKANQLSPAQVEHNESLAEQYNPEGSFPQVLIVDQEGQILSRIPYRSHMSPAAFMAQIPTPQLN